MASSTVYDTIKSHLVTTFSGVYDVLDFDQIDPAKQQSSDPFLLLEEVAGGEDLVAFGDPNALRHREDGALNVYCASPAPEALADVRAIAETVADSLRLATLNGVRIRSVSPPSADRSNEGIWTIGSFTVIYDLYTHYARP